MIALLYIAAAVLVAVVIYLWDTAMDSDTPLPLFGLICIVIVAFGCFIIPTVVLPSRAVGATICRNWSKQTGYPSKFRVLNWFDTGQCLARTPDGHWTKNTNIIVNVPARSKP